MNRKPVSSSNINSIGYDLALGILEVEFHSGGVYQYFDVPELLHHQFMTAVSHGQFFEDHIKYHYRYQKVK